MNISDLLPWNEMPLSCTVREQWLLFCHYTLNYIDCLVCVIVHLNWIKPNVSWEGRNMPAAQSSDMVSCAIESRISWKHSVLKMFEERNVKSLNWKGVVFGSVWFAEIYNEQQLNEMLYGRSLLSMSGIPSIQSEEIIFWMGVVWEPKNVCKYCICIWKENWNILLVISVILKDFLSKCKERVHNVIIQIYSDKCGNFAFFCQVFT